MEKQKPMQRTKEVLEELQEKYKLKKTEPSPETPKEPTGGMIQGMAEVLQELRERNDARLAWLRSLKKERHILPAIEFATLCRISKMLREFMRVYPDSTEERLRQLEYMLDSFDLWVGKFRTECSGGASRDVPLQPSSPDDSVYYLTPSGATLRLKMTRRNKDMASVIQVFMEKILFVNSIEDEVSETPRIGYYVHEFASPSLNQALKSGDRAGYTPVLDLFKKDGNLEAVDQLDEQSGKLTLNYWRHPGDRVNAILRLPRATTAGV